MDSDVTIERRGRLAVVRIDRPDRRNALDQRCWLHLAERMNEAQADEAIDIVVLRGAGGHFGAGADISEFPTVFGDRAATLDYFATMEAAMTSIEAGEKPIVAAIEGLCIGACVALALACDIRFAHPAARFAITPAKLGIGYPYGDIRRVVNAIGPGRARTLLYSGAEIDAAEAGDIGLADVVASDFEQELGDFIALLLDRSQWTIRATKAAVRAIGAGLDAAAAGYPDRLVEAVSGADFHAGMAAFMAKRARAFPFPREAD